MSRIWSTSGHDLALVLEPEGGKRAALERAVRGAVRDGRLQPGTRLPSTRVLARDLGLARGTVADAYAQLIAEGYLVARHGSGTTVADIPAPPAAAPAAATPVPAPWADFRPGTPDLSSFPRALWLAAARRALRAAPDAAFGYGDPRGRPELRRALAAYLGRARGVRTTPDQIVVCNGFSQALGLLAVAMRGRGIRTVGLEAPTIPDHHAIITAAGLRAVHIPVDGGGPRPETLAREGAGAVVLTPAHQALLGLAAAPDQRAAVLRWARESGGMIIEDDYDGEFRFGRQPVGALQGLDPERIVYAGTASKTLAPGLRLAWLALPPDLLEPVVMARRLADRHTGVIDQLTLAELIVSGGFDRHIRRMRGEYRRRRDLLLAALAAHAPAARPTGIAAGLHLTLMLPPDSPDLETLVARAAARGVALHPLHRFYPAGLAAPPALVIGYAAPPPHVYAAAVTALVELLSEGDTADQP